MKKFNTKQELADAYAADKVARGVCSADVAAIAAEDAPRYVPHIYRGGHLIRGFGYSTERIGVYVDADKAGTPV